MAITDKSLTYRGDLKAAAGSGSTVLFVTAHAEGQPTALYRLDAAKLALAQDPLPAGGVDLVADGDAVWVAGTDRRIYKGSVGGGKLGPVGPELDDVPAALALVSDGNLAVLAGSRVVVLSGKDGKVRQQLDLPEPGSAIAADPTGNWLVVGTSKGTVAVFDCEDKPQFLMGESAKLHEGAVTALLFEPDELRFLSAGADGKLLSTHARGKLEPEDKGKGNNHADRVATMLWAPAGDRLLTGAKDSSVKSWPRVGNVKPATLKDGVAKVVDLGVVTLYNRSNLVVACEDNTIRFFPLDAAGKFGDLTHRTHGAAAWAKYELSTDEPKRREAALRALAGWADTAAVEALAAQVSADADHALRLLATQLLSASPHPRAAKLLEPGLKHGDEAVRVAALAGLRKHLGETDLRPLDLALAAEKPDVSRLAVQALEKLAAKDDQALARLTAALDARTFEVRTEALRALEAVHGAKSPEADLVALGSKHADVRGLALYRLHQRQWLDDGRVRAALRRSGEDKDAGVRKVAFLVSLFTRPGLAAALRGRDPEVERQLDELENIGKEQKPEDAKAEKKEAKEPKEAKPKAAKKAAGPQLEQADYEPLLQATASRALDTCLRGARGLAVLGDERALGLLLQLSREQESSARVEVARALAALDDPRSAGRLRSLLFDADAAVRDAAFTALARLNEADPLAAADAGLSASFEDVRRRGLQAIIAAARKKAPQSADDPAWGLLIRALNDAAPAVRTEAFKAVLNLGVGGGGVNTLRFVLQSVHADVRREVLTEAMAQSGPQGQPWAWGLLLDFLNDPDPKLREEAFGFATKKTKELGPLEAGLKSTHADSRRRAVDALVKKHSKAAQSLLTTALTDPDKEVRTAALDALIGDDVREALHAALESPHDDVTARAARALARHGDPAALKPLVALATAPEPQNQPKERIDEWAGLVETALDGLAELANDAALPHVLPLLNSTHDKVRKAAAWALAWVAMDRHPGSLRQAMQHADPQVKYQAALGLALGGEASAAPLVFSAEGGKVLAAKERIVAALALGPAGEDHLIAFLDHADERVRVHSILLLMLLELKTSGGRPSRCLACLASRAPRVRLRAARGLDSFRDPALFLQYVTRLFASRAGVHVEGQPGQKKDPKAKPWDIPPAVVDTVAELVAFGSPLAKARTARLLSRLFKEEQSAWDRAWAVHEARFADEIARLKQEAAKRKPPAAQYTPAQLEELAFGAYVGLVREQGGSYAAKERASHEPHIVRVRQTALTWVLELAKRDQKYAGPAQAVMVQALGDPNQPVRSQAFEQLQALGMDATALGQEALEAGHTDLGVRGLELLSGGAAGKTSAKGQQVLEAAMLSRTDDLAAEAAKLLVPLRGPVAVAATALGAANESLRQQAVAWLAAEYDKADDAKKELRKALESRYAKVREAAALELATKRDAAAFDALVKLLADAQDQGRQRIVVNAIQRLGDNRGPAALLDRLENDPAKTADANTLIAAAGSFRRPEVGPRLLALMEKDKKFREPAGNALLAVSGYDQRIEDAEDEKPDREWEKKQYPRHDAVLAGLADKSAALGETKLLLKLTPGLRWSRGKDADPVLGRLAAHPDEKVRQAAVEAAGWRLRKRKGPADALAGGLSHRDPTTQFLAAEGLARAGRGEGLSVLLSAIDFLPDLSLRERAVTAMGELGDARALDTVLRLANEAGHALQEEAAEAIGRMGRGAQAEEIFKLLERLSKPDSSLAGNALRGLRWLDTPAGWQLIRKRAEEDSFGDRETAAELLGYHDDPANREVLLRLVAAADDYSVVTKAWESAKRIWGEAAIEPHYAWVQNPLSEHYEDGESVRRLGDEGDAKRVFEILPKVPDDLADALATRLLSRPALPAKEAETAITSNDSRTARLAAQVLGRAGTASKQVGAAVEAALAKWQKSWDDRRPKVEPMVHDWDQEDPELTQLLTPTLRAVVWAAGRLGVAQDALVRIATTPGDDSYYRPVRLEAVSALAAVPKPSDAVLSAMEAAAVGDDPPSRALATDALARHNPKRAAALAERVLPDRVSFNRLANDLTGDAKAAKADGLTPVLRTAVAQGHYQGIALPHLIARGDVDALAAVASDRNLPEATRLGAVEGLGKLAADAAEAKLRAIGTVKEEDEEVRKSAWRALRRSKRARESRQPA